MGTQGKRYSTIVDKLPTTHHGVGRYIRSCNMFLLSWWDQCLS